MKLNLAVNGVKQQIEILVPAPGCRFRLGRGPERSADVATPEPGVYSVLLDGRSYDARVARTIGHLIVSVQGHRFEIEVRDPRRWSPNAASRPGGDIETVRAPMPGKVVRVLIAPGDTVEAGQGVMVVEAMKMQNEMKASRAGRVLAVAAKEGATVTAGQPWLSARTDGSRVVLSFRLINTPGMSVGTYGGSVRVTSKAGLGAVVGVTLQVVPATGSGAGE